MKKKCTLLSIIIFSILFSHNVFAADYFTTTSKTQINVDETFDVYININTNGDIINSGEGNISFPSDLLNVVSINNTSSVFSMWPEKPIFSNQNGTLSFNGGLPNPGYSGSKGTVLKITFKAKKVGSAPISIASGSIYSNDGTGTDVLKSKRGITLTINQPAVKKVEEEIDNLPKKEITKIDSANLPPIPNISSKDLLDLNSWSTKKNILLEWDIPKGVDAVQYSIDSNESSIPNTLKIPPLNNTQLVNMANGISNFHIRFRNSSGWGEILHQKIKVDVINPEISSIEQYVNDLGLIFLKVKVLDNHSGVDKVEVYLNNKIISESKEYLSLDESLIANLPLLKTGINKLNIKVYDVAGNFSEKDFEVNYHKPTQPLISVDKKEFIVGDNIEVKIKSYPETELIFWIKDQNLNIDKVILKTDLLGFVNYNLQNIQPSGNRTIWVSLNNECENTCVLSEQININILDKKIIKFDKVFINNVKEFILSNKVLPWVIAFIFMILYMISLLRNSRNKNRSIIQELNKAEIDVYKIFKVLKTDARRYKTVLKRNKIDLIEKDKQIIDNLEQDLEEAETYFAKRIEKIETELEL